jgi:hypothetical protein
MAVMGFLALSVVALPCSVLAQSVIRSPSAGGLCLDISTPEGGTVRAGSNVIAWQCHGAANQIFRVNSNGTISAPNAGGLCLDISTPEGGAVRAGSNVIAWQCHGAANQIFRVNSNGTISAPNAGGLCLTFPPQKEALSGQARMLLPGSVMEPLIKGWSLLAR